MWCFLFYLLEQRRYHEGQWPKDQLSWREVSMYSPFIMTMFNPCPTLSSIIPRTLKTVWFTVNTRSHKQDMRRQRHITRAGGQRPEDQRNRGSEERTETPTFCFGCRSLVPWRSRLRSSCRSWSDNPDSVCPCNSLHLTRTGTKTDWLIRCQISFNHSSGSGRSLTFVFGELLGGLTGLVNVNVYIQSSSHLTWNTSYRTTKMLNSGYLQLLKCCV